MRCISLRASVLAATLLAASPLVRLASAQTSPPAWSASLDSLISAELARTLTPGAQVAVVISGRVVYSRGFGVADIETGRAVTPQTLFRVGSVTKMVTGAVLAQLAAEGRVDLRAPISRYVTDLEGKRIGTVTTHQLLTHHAGWIDNAVAYGRMGEGALGEVMSVQSDTLFFTDSGRVLSYSNPGYSMAGYVAERATRRRFGDLASDLVLRKMGMPNATFRPLHAMTRDFSQGHVGLPTAPGTIVRPYTENTAQWAAGFLFATAQDLARFAIAVMDSGRLEGVAVLSPDAVRAMTTGYVLIPESPGSRYAYGLRIEQRGAERLWFHGGAINGFDAQVMMFPDRRTAVIVLDNRSGSPLRGIVDLVMKQAHSIEPQAPPSPAQPRVASAAERALIVGVFSQSTRRVELAVESDSLIFRQGPSVAGVRLVGDDVIRVSGPLGPPTMIRLVRDADGRVAFLHQGLRALARQP